MESKHDGRFRREPSIDGLNAPARILTNYPERSRYIELSLENLDFDFNPDGLGFLR